MPRTVVPLCGSRRSRPHWAQAGGVARTSSAPRGPVHRCSPPVHAARCTLPRPGTRPGLHCSAKGSSPQLVIDIPAPRSPVTRPASRWARPSFQPCRRGRGGGSPFDPARKVRVHIAIIAAVFPIIFVGELPDKTMFASLVMSTRGKPASVWLGAAGAFLLHVVIANTIGVALFHLLPHRVLDGIVAFMFLAGAALAIREARKAQQETVLIDTQE